MENITIGQVATILAFIVGFITSIKYLMNEFNRKVDKTLQPLIEKIDNMEQSHMDKLDSFKLDSVKRDLINLMCFAEKGEITEEQKKLAHELFDVYTGAGRNSYVHDRWEHLVKENKI